MNDESPAIETGAPSSYVDEDKVDNRSAFGRALKDLGEKNIPFGRPICVLDCDLASSVKSSDFAKVFPDHFFQGGVQEHNTATVAGALSTLGVVSFFADFGAFGMDETYNQQRLNDINKTNLKLVLTHLGLDVGQDGKTHQCIDYIGLARNLYNFKPIVPADPNQVDRAVRYITATKGNFIIGTGRSQWPVIRRENGQLFYADGYRFVYGAMDVIREGDDGAIIAYGGMVDRALQIRAALKKFRPQARGDQHGMRHRGRRGGNGAGEEAPLRLYLRGPQPRDGHRPGHRHVASGPWLSREDGAFRRQ